MNLLNRCIPYLLISFLALTTAAATHAEGRSQVLLQTTKGDIMIDLYPDQAPETVKNFLRLVDSGFYNDLIFHRVIPGFMIQAGGYDRRLTYKEAPRLVPNESDTVLKNLRGFVAWPARTIQTLPAASSISTSAAIRPWTPSPAAPVTRYSAE